MTSGEKVVTRARRYLGVVERPMGSNRSSDIDRWSGRWGLRGVPWCGTYSDSMYGEADVNDGGLGHPSTWQIVENGRKEGRLRSKPTPGCYVVWRPGSRGHVEIIIRQLTPSAARTIGGNTGDAVREHDRDITGAFFVVPPVLEEKPKPVYKTVYWWEDPKAKPVRHGLYAATASREKAVRAWVKAGGSPGHVRRGKLSVKVNGRWRPRYTFWTGPRKRSPDFSSEAKRDANLKKVALATGHTLRPRSKRVRVS